MYWKLYTDEEYKCTILLILGGKWVYSRKEQFYRFVILTKGFNSFHLYHWRYLFLKIWLMMLLLLLCWFRHFVFGWWKVVVLRAVGFMYQILLSHITWRSEAVWISNIRLYCWSFDFTFLFYWYWVSDLDKKNWCIKRSRIIGLMKNHNIMYSSW